MKIASRRPSSSKHKVGKPQGRKASGGKSGGGRGGSAASSGLRREVQDSLGELERLIEQQHRQVFISSRLSGYASKCLISTAAS